MGRTDIQKMFAELDELYNVNDIEGADECMNRWLRKVCGQKDWYHELTILNELIGFYRKSGAYEKGMEMISRAFRIVEEYGLDNHKAGATTWLNGATALRAFGKYDTAYLYFEKTMNIYRKLLDSSDYRFASLYNNMALLLSDMNRGKEAEVFFYKALEILKDNSDTEAEAANTYVSMAHMYQSVETDPETRQIKVKEVLSEAFKILRKNAPLPDSYFAYICGICAKSFSYFGMEKESKELKALAEDFYRKKGAE